MPWNNHFNTGFFFQQAWLRRLPSIPERLLSEPLTRSCREREALAFVLQLLRFVYFLFLCVCGSGFGSVFQSISLSHTMFIIKHLALEMCFVHTHIYIFRSGNSKNIVHYLRPPPFMEGRNHAMCLQVREGRRRRGFIAMRRKHRRHRASCVQNAVL